MAWWPRKRGVGCVFSWLCCLSAVPKKLVLAEKSYLWGLEPRIVFYADVFWRSRGAFCRFEFLPGWEKLEFGCAPRCDKTTVVHPDHRLCIQRNLFCCYCCRRFGIVRGGRSVSRKCRTYDCIKGYQGEDVLQHISYYSSNTINVIPNFFACFLPIFYSF